MRRLSSIITTIALLTPTISVAQTVDQELAAEALRKAKLENAAAEAARFDALRATTGPSATIATPDKGVEGTLLRLALQRGVALQIAAGTKDALGLPIVGKAKVSPRVVFGSTPPSMNRWVAFEAQRTQLVERYDDAIKRWQEVYKKPAKGAAAGGDGTNNFKSFIIPIVPLITTILPTAISLFKPEYSTQGYSVTPTESEFEPTIYDALARRGFEQGGLQKYEIDTSTKTKANDLLRPLSEKNKTATTLFNTQYLPILTAAGGDPSKIEDKNVAAAGQILKSLIDSYDTIEKALYVDVGGVSAATSLDRERVFVTDLNPVIYITAVDASATMATKKTVFNGWSSKPASVAGVMTTTYVVVPRSGEKPKVRRTATCLVTERSFNSILAVAQTDIGWNQCASNDEIKKIAKK